MDSVFLWPALTPLFPTPTAHWKAGHTVLSQPHTCFFISLLLHLWTYCSYVFSHSIMSDSLQPFWTVSHQAPVSMGFFRQECWKKKKKRMLEWVGISSFRGSSLLMVQTCVSYVSCIAGRFFTHWAIGKALELSTQEQWNRLPLWRSPFPLHLHLWPSGFHIWDY